MQRKFWLVLAGLLMVSLVAAPMIGQAKEKGDKWGNYHAMQRQKLIKELKLTPDKAKAFQAVSDKYRQSRKTIIEALKKDNQDLKTAMATAKPDEAKLKALTGDITGQQNALLDSFKAQRDEELALLTPEQQANYLLILAKWHKEQMEKWEKHGKKMKREKK